MCYNAGPSQAETASVGEISVTVYSMLVSLSEPNHQLLPTLFHLQNPMSETLFSPNCTNSFSQIVCKMCCEHTNVNNP